MINIFVLNCTFAWPLFVATKDDMTTFEAFQDAHCETGERNYDTVASVLHLGLLPELTKVCFTQTSLHVFPPGNISTETICNYFKALYSVEQKLYKKTFNMFLFNKECQFTCIFRIYSTNEKNNFK